MIQGNNNINSISTSSSKTNNTTTNANNTKIEEKGFKFKKGFLLRDQEDDSNNINNNNNSISSIANNDNKQALAEKEKKPEEKVVDLTHLKSSGETVKEKFISQIKTEVKENSSDMNKSLKYINDKKDEWCNTNLLTMISQKPNLMKFFMDPT